MSSNHNFFLVIMTLIYYVGYGSPIERVRSNKEHEIKVVLDQYKKLKSLSLNKKLGGGRFKVGGK